MKAYIVQSQRRVEPFGDHPRDCLIGNQPLAQHQEETLRALDLEQEFQLILCKMI